MNARVLGHEVDLRWPDHRVIVETDGSRYHRHRRRFESDRARDAALAAAGWSVVRFTWRQAIHETLLVTVRIARVLALRSTELERSVDVCDSAHIVRA